MSNNDPKITKLDSDALAAEFEKNRSRLKRMVDLRLDRRIQKRVTSSDVLQQSYIDLAQMLDDYDPSADEPLYVWMRRIIGVQLTKVHEDHLGSESRDVNREISLQRGRMPQATSFALASRLIGKITEAEQQFQRAERQVRLQEILNGMDIQDREIIAMRNFEQMSNSEVAAVLQIRESEAGIRYLKALRRLQKEVKQAPDLLDSNAGGE